MRVIDGILLSIERDGLIFLRNRPKDFWRGIDEIGEWAFSCEKDLHEIAIEKVTTIRRYAFNECINLSKIKLPNTLEKIGEHAFCGCCKISEINLPYGLLGIEQEAFEGCSELKTLTIPQSVNFIGKSLFKNCENLETIIIEDAHKLGSYINSALEGFEFNSFEENGDEIKFIRNIEKEKE